jgi:hypothetical protein
MLGFVADRLMALDVDQRCVSVRCRRSDGMMECLLDVHHR